MIAFTVPGTPQTKGSARAWVNKRTGRAIVTNDNPKTKSWAGIVSTHAIEAMAGAPPLTGPVAVHLVFGLQRPKAHFTARGLRPDAPSLVSKKPDADKLARACLDALTAVCFVDDAQVASLLVEKRYAAPGVNVTVKPAE